MKTTTLIATIAAASALVFIQPAFAQFEGGSASEITAHPQESTMDPSFEEPLSDGPVLAPAPQEPVQSEPGSLYVPPPPPGFIEPSFGHPGMNANSPELIAPYSRGITSGGFNPAGGYRR